MSLLLDRLNFLARKNVGTFSEGHGVTTNENRDWEDAYRKRWQHDKIVRSTHGVNCTGSCSWKVYVKGGIITWETQQTDYPRTRADLPNHEPRGCSRGASYSWYVYSANRVKYPLIRSRLLKLWRKERTLKTPVAAWAAIQQDPAKRADYMKVRGLGGFVRATWEEVNEIIAAANAYTAKTYGPDRVIGFSPIPAMSMVSYAAGSRYLSLLGGVCMSFYDWYCDLPPASPMTWGEQTDVPESADWYNAGFLMLWGSNVPQTRTPDAHFYTEVRYKGTKSVVVSPDYSEAAKFSDLWLHPKQGTDAALAMALGHVILREYHLDRQVPYFENYCRKYSDFPMLVMLSKKDGRYVPDRFLRASDFKGDLGEGNNPDWKTVAFDTKSGAYVAPQGSIGFRWGDDGQWNLEEKDGKGKDVELAKSFIDKDSHDAVADVAFPYFGNREHDYFEGTDHDSVLVRKVPARKLKIKGGDVMVATVFDLFAANYGLDRGLGDENSAKSYDEGLPYTPAWAEKITGVPRDQIIAVAREFATNAEKTNGRSMVILGAGLNHWYHMDMNYRGIINMLVMCGCIGQSGGGWSHYVGQEKLRPQTGWTALAFALDWNRPPRHMNSTSFFYAHTDQWRYETVKVQDILSPTAPEGAWDGTMIDYNIRAERMGWLPSAPQLQTNPLELAKEAAASGKEPKDFIANALKNGTVTMSCEDPDHEANWPRNMFVWRSNLLGSSGKGHEYFLKHLLGTSNGLLGKDLGQEGAQESREAVWHENAPEGKLDLLVTLDFRMSTTCVYSDIVLPTATWYEKNDLNTSDMHPFIHPLSSAADPAWEARSDWEIFKGIAKKFSEVAPEVLGVEKDIVLVPTLHDTAGELAQPKDVLDWKKGEVEPIPGKTMPSVVVVERDYPNLYKRYTSVGPLLDKLGNGGKGISWNTEHEVELLGNLNGKVQEPGASEGRPRIYTDVDATEVILSLAPETNGEVAVKAWEALSKFTGRDHSHLAIPKEDEKIRYRDIVAQPRKIISSPTWSGIESETVCYNAGYTNVHELIPWRTLTGRQQLYQDHLWMRAFGEGFCVYRPPIDTKTVNPAIREKADGQPHLVLNFITPHQKWGIHSTYTDNLLMLTLNRGGPVVWISEPDAAKAGIVDNDWVEVYNANGAIVARAVVSQRMKDGTVFMYHAQEKIVNTPGSPLTGQRGGIHNSVTRIITKPTHMIGGYAHQSYGFNYYGTVGSNRDEFVVVRKLEKVDWMEGPLEEGNQSSAAKRQQNENPCANWNGAQSDLRCSLPSGAIYKREDDGIVLIDQEKCRGWRMCVSGCPYKKIYYNWSSGKSEKCIFCYPRIEAGQPTVCSETCVGRIRYLGVMLYDADRISEAASTANEQDLYQEQLNIFLDPNDPAVIEQARKDGVPEAWLESAKHSPVYKMAMDWKIAFPLHPEYRTLPMVWYVPPLSPLQSAAAAGKLGMDGPLPDVRSMRIPVRYLANLLTAGKEEPVISALERMLAMRAYMRAKTVDGVIDEAIADRVGMSSAMIEEMYHIMAIANYEDRFVIPTTHREITEDAYDVRGSCGFTFGNGCSGGTSTEDLFGSKRQKVVQTPTDIFREQV